MSYQTIVTCGPRFKQTNCEVVKDMWTFDEIMELLLIIFRYDNTNIMFFKWILSFGVHMEVFTDDMIVFMKLPIKNPGVEGICWWI